MTGAQQRGIRLLALLCVSIAAVLQLTVPTVAAVRATSERVATAGAYSYDSSRQLPVARVSHVVRSEVAGGEADARRRPPSTAQLLTVVSGVAAEGALAGSGPVAGVLEVSGRVKSVGAFRNYNPRGGVEYVFDPATSRFAVGRPGAGSGLKGSPHQQLADSIGADQSGVVGGMLRRGPGGEFITDEMSGHFYQNWTPAIRSQFVDFMEGFGLNVVH